MEKKKKEFTVKELVEFSELCLRKSRYLENTITLYKKHWQNFMVFCEENNYSTFSEDVGKEYLEYKGIDSMLIHIKDLTSHERQITRSIRILSDCKLYGKVMSNYKGDKTVYDFKELTLIQELFEIYSKQNNFSEQTIRTYERYLRYFLIFLCNNGIEKVNQIHPKHLVMYASTLSGYSNSKIRSALNNTRLIMKLLYLNGYIEEDLREHIPTVNVIKDKKIPSAWAKEDVEKIISVIDRATPMGKRDYAILIIISHLGLRISDVRNLKLNNLNWREKKIEIVMSKTNQLLTLPITEIVGDALIDYIKNGRPKTDAQYVFITHRPPFEKFGNNNNFFFAIDKYMKKANIVIPKGKKHGVHSLRHSLASILLEQNVSLPVISDILGHLSSDSTKYYLKVDTAKLRECALSMEVIDNA